MPNSDVKRMLFSIYTARCRGRGEGGFEPILPPSRTRFYAYGRQALAAALKSAGVQSGDIVLLPGFMCAEVLASLAFVGAVPRFYEVDQALCINVGLWKNRYAKVRAVVVVNYFGFPQPLEEIRAWCRTEDAVLIEDNAHGFLSHEGAVPLGRRGDIGIFSLRKTLTIPNGAALVDNRPNPVKHEEVLYEGSTLNAEWRCRGKVLLKPLMQWCGVGAAQGMLAAIRAARLMAVRWSVPLSDKERETTMPRERISPLTTRWLEKTNISAESQRRRGLYKLCLDLLEGYPDVRFLFTNLPDGVVPQGFPFCYEGSDARSFMKASWQRGVPVLSWPDHLPSALPEVPPHYRNIMLVPFLW